MAGNLEVKLIKSRAAPHDVKRLCESGSMGSKCLFEELAPLAFGPNVRRHEIQDEDDDCGDETDDHQVFHDAFTFFVFVF
jgi:hypothetical protein